MTGNRPLFDGALILIRTASPTRTCAMATPWLSRSTAKTASPQARRDAHGQARDGPLAGSIAFRASQMQPAHQSFNHS